jgi:serine/threonine-protein kinase
MAPEQITMSGALSPASDVFSAGGVLYELLTGQPAFTGDTVHRVMYRIVSEEHVPLATAAPDAPPALEAVLRRALAKDTADRYRDASEMLSALTPIAAAAAGTSRAHTTLEHAVSESLRLNRKQPVAAVVAVPPARASRWRVAALPVAASVVMVGSLMVFQRYRPATPDSQPAEPAAVSALTATQPSVVTSPETTTLAPNDGRSAARTDAEPTAPRRSDTEKAPPLQRQAAVPTPKVPAPPVKQASESSIVAQTGANASQVAADTSPVPPRTIRSDPPPLAVADTPPVSKGPVVEAPRPVTRDEIDALVRAYAEAIESRNTAAVRQLYPAIRSDQVDGFQRFFTSVRTLRVSLSLDPVQLGAATATGRISGSYDFTNAQGQANRQPVSFQATFRRVGDRWVIESVR